MSELLNLIRTIDPTKHVEGQPTYREINKAFALFLGWYYYTPSEAKAKWRGSWKRGAWIHPDDCRDGQPQFCQLHGTDIYKDCPNFCGSLDALKAVQDAEFGGWEMSMHKTWDNGHSVCLHNEDEEPMVEFETEGYLPTMQLAWMDALYQAITYKRETND